MASGFLRRWSTGTSSPDPAACTGWRTARRRQSRSFPWRRRATWDRKQQRFDERLRILGAFKWNQKVIGNQVTSSFACSDDPLITGSACNGTEHDNRTALDQLSESYQKHGRPLLTGKVSLQAATAMAAKHPAPGGPQATVPPPKKKPTPLRSAESKKPPPLLSASGSASAAIANAVAVAPHVIVRSPKAGAVSTDGTLHVDVAVPESAVDQYDLMYVQLTWEWAPDSGRLPDRNPTWTGKNMLARIKWTGHDGALRTAAIDLPYTRFAESTKWRMRAFTPTEAVAPSEWIEFSVKAP